MSIGPAAADDGVIWHDVECSAYDGDLGLWAELASKARGPVLELGCGTGRVALHLAGKGLEVVALDRAPDLLAELRSRAAAAGMAIETVEADARGFALERPMALILGPMQFVQILGGALGRGGMLGAAAASLPLGGQLGLTITEPEDEESSPPPAPDVRELDGWIYSSLPIEIRDVPDGFEVHRLRQIVSPAGELTEEVDVIRFDRLSPETLTTEAQAVGLRLTERREIPPTVRYVGSTVLLFERSER
jgi:SAM-dependent methyltransferase